MSFGNSKLVLLVLMVSGLDVLASEGQMLFRIERSKEIALTQIFVKFDGGSFMFPSIAYAKLIGIESQTGIEISEVIIPDK